MYADDISEYLVSGRNFSKIGNSSTCIIT